MQFVTTEDSLKHEYSGRTRQHGIHKTTAFAPYRALQHEIWLLGHPHQPNFVNVPLYSNPNQPNCAGHLHHTAPLQPRELRHTRVTKPLSFLRCQFCILDGLHRPRSGQKQQALADCTSISEKPEGTRLPLHPLVQVCPALGIWDHTDFTSACVNVEQPGHKIATVQTTLATTYRILTGEGSKGDGKLYYSHNSCFWVCPATSIAFMAFCTPTTSILLYRSCPAIHCLSCLQQN
jgi:hypothetical protein